MLVNIYFFSDNFSLSDTINPASLLEWCNEIIETRCEVMGVEIGDAITPCYPNGGGKWCSDGVNKRLAYRCDPTSEEGTKHAGWEKWHINYHHGSHVYQGETPRGIRHPPGHPAGPLGDVRQFRCGRLKIAYKDKSGVRRNGTLHPDYNQAKNFPGVSS